jgi:hypothetical protein
MHEQARPKNLQQQPVLIFLGFAFADEVAQFARNISLHVNHFALPTPFFDFQPLAQPISSIKQHE